MSKVKTILARIEQLQDISARLGGELQGVAAVAKVAASEIESDGQISADSCAAMATILKSSEDDALKLFTGLLSVHQSMSGFIPAGANEGNKKWP